MVKPVRLLLVEDNPGDAELIRDTLDAGQLSLEVSVAVDGADALDYLFRNGNYSGVEAPDLIVLDLNLPKLSGLQVLREIKQNEQLKRIPVVVLTSSEAERDLLESYQLGANCCVAKPMDLSSFQFAVRAIEAFWTTVVKLPGRRMSA